MKKWLDDYNTLIYSAYTQGKSVIVERCIRPLKANDSASCLNY